jgi:hypothetical protein
MLGIAREKGVTIKLQRAWGINVQEVNEPTVHKEGYTKDDHR